MTRQARLKMIEENMSKFGNLPDNYDEFCETAVHKDNNYLFFNKTNNTAYCSGCKTHGTLKLLRNKATHNKYNTCCNCGRYIVAKSEAYGRKNLENVEWSLLVETNEDDLLFRYVRSVKRFDIPDKPTIRNDEILRATLSEKTNKTLWFGFYDTVGWSNYRKPVGWYISNYREPTGPIMLFNKDLESELVNTRWKYSCINKVIEYKKINNTRDILYTDDHVRIFDFMTTYFQSFAEKPFIEKLIKCGFMKLVFPERYVDTKKEIDAKANKVHEILKLTKCEYKVLDELSEWEDLHIIKAIRGTKIKLNSHNISALKNFNVNYRNVIDLTRVMSFDKACERYAKASYKYCDYINMAIQLGYDLKKDSVVWPQNLEEAHNVAAELFNKQKTEKLKNILLSTAKCDAYNYKTDKYMIVVPASGNDIVKEGQALHHCVATYVDDVALGKTLILFIRKVDKPKKSFFTIEVKYNQLVQIHGLRNCDPDNEVKKFADEFIELLNKNKANAA